MDAGIRIMNVFEISCEFERIRALLRAIAELAGGSTVKAHDVDHAVTILAHQAEKSVKRVEEQVVARGLGY